MPMLMFQFMRRVAGKNARKNDVTTIKNSAIMLGKQSFYSVFIIRHVISFLLKKYNIYYIEHNPRVIK